MVTFAQLKEDRVTTALAADVQRLRLQVELASNGYLAPQELDGPE